MKKIIVIYDNWCPNCSRFMKIVQNLDWFYLIEGKPLRNDVDLQSFSNLDLDLAKQQMASFTHKWNYGYSSIFNILLRLPIAWGFIPFFYFLKITGLGQYIYKEFAINRKIIPLSCDENSCEL